MLDRDGIKKVPLGEYVRHGAGRKKLFLLKMPGEVSIKETLQHTQTRKSFFQVKC